MRMLVLMNFENSHYIKQGTLVQSWTRIETKRLTLVQVEKNMTTLKFLKENGAAQEIK